MDRKSLWDDNGDDLDDIFGGNNDLDDILSSNGNPNPYNDNQDIFSDSGWGYGDNPIDTPDVHNTYNPLPDNNPFGNSGHRKSKWGDFNPNPEGSSSPPKPPIDAPSPKSNPFPDWFDKETLLKIIGIAIGLLVVIIILVKVFSDRNTYNQINTVLENIVSIVLMWFIFSLIAWWIVIHTIGINFSSKIKGSCFFLMGIWVALSFPFPSLAILLIIFLIICWFFKKSFRR